MGGDTATLEAIRATMEERGVEFVFAQFVDLYGRPSAKLDSGGAPRRARRGGRRVRRVRGGRDRAVAERPGHRGDARPGAASRSCRGSRTWRASRVTSRSRARRGRTARGRSSATMLAQAAEQGYEFKIGMRARVLPRRSCNADGTIEIADKLDTLEKPCYDMAGPDAAVRLPDDRVDATATSSAGATTRTTTRTRTASSSRTSSTPTRSRAATARSSSATWCTRSPSSTGGSRRSCRSRSRT